MSIGGTLAAARQEAGLTVTQVSESTRIRETIIRAIERDDYTLCGGDFYSRGHIRGIARAIGLDPEPLVREYDETHGGAPQAIPVVQAFAPERAVKFRERRSPNWSAAMVVAIVLVVVYGIVRTATGHETHQASPRAANPPLAATPTPTHRDTVAQAPRTEVTVRVKAKRGSWLNVHDAKGHSLFSGVIHQGQTEEWTSKKRIKLIIGNGGGVAIIVNGKNLGTPGTGGQVVRLSFGPGDPDNG